MIYIITPVFNRKQFTRNYLYALQQQSEKNFKTIIIDDGCTDGTSKMIEDEFPDIILLKEEGDLWWTAATNIGVKYALEQDDVEYIMTLNDDTLPMHDYIEKMLIKAKEKPKALLGAFTVDAKNGKAIYGGERLDWATCAFNFIKLNAREKYVGLNEVNLFPGRGLLIPIEVFEKIGLYDENNFPQTIADLDFTVRAVNAGYKIYCNYDAKIGAYPDESGGVEIRKRKSWKNYYLHLFGMRGAGNLKWFTLFVMKNAPKRYLIQCLIIGNSRRIVGYLRDWVREVLYGRT